MLDLRPLGDRAWLARFSTEAEAARWAESVRRIRLSGVADVVIAYQTAAVFADPHLNQVDGLEEALLKVEPTVDDRPPGRLIEIPVLYDGPDLGEVALARGLSADDVIAFHAGVDYYVFAIGFLPGFPYAGYLAPAISGMPRRAEPRVKVPAGSVAIAGQQTGIYPGESPGGWHLLGWTPLLIADPVSGFFPIRAGDRLRFRPINSSEFEARRHERLLRESTPDWP